MINLFMKSDFLLDRLFEAATGTANQANISSGSVLNFILPMPPLGELQRIIEKVDAIFYLIGELTEKYKQEQDNRAKLAISSLMQLSRGDSNLALTHLAEIVRTKADAAELRKAILQLAVSGQLVPQDLSEGTGGELYEQIQLEKQKLITMSGLKKQKILSEISEDEIPFDIPENWKCERLGNVSIYQQRGKSPKYTEASAYPVLSQRCVRTNHIDWDVIKYVTPESIEKYEKFRFLQSGDLLLNSTGTGTMGRVGIFQPNASYEKTVADSHVTVVRMPKKVVPEFVHICLNAPFIQDDVESKASGSTNQIEWNLSSIQNEPVPLPPFAEQVRIVQKTAHLINLVAKLEQYLESK